MRQTILIGSKSVEMVANAATPFRFRNVFKKDLLKIFSNTSEDNVSAQLEAGQMLAFIMNKQAEGVDMNKLTEEQFYTWLEDFSSSDMYDSLEAVVSLWQATGETSSTPKNRTGKYKGVQHSLVYA